MLTWWCTTWSCYCCPGNRSQWRNKRFTMLTYTPYNQVQQHTYYMPILQTSDENLPFCSVHKHHMLRSTAVGAQGSRRYVNGGGARASKANTSQSFRRREVLFEQHVHTLRDVKGIFKGKRCLHIYCETRSRCCVNFFWKNVTILRAWCLLICLCAHSKTPPLLQTRIVTTAVVVKLQGAWPAVCHTFSSSTGEHEMPGVFLHYCGFHPWSSRFACC